MTRYIIIGDIHGCLAELKELVQKVEWNPTSDRLILAGDLVDRGPNSSEVVKWARENKVEVVRGNHDDRYVQFDNKIKQAKTGKQPKWLKNYPDRMAIYKEMSPEDIAFLRHAPTIIKLKELKTIVVHAGLMPGVDIDEQEDNTKMHIRFLYDNGNCYSKAPLDAQNGYIQPRSSFFWAEKYQGSWDVVYGHHVWDKTEIKIHENEVGARCWGIDTGCCFKGKLTALVLTPGQQPAIFQVDSRKDK